MTNIIQEITYEVSVEGNTQGFTLLLPKPNTNLEKHIREVEIGLQDKDYSIKVLSSTPIEVSESEYKTLKKEYFKSLFESIDREKRKKQEKLDKESKERRDNELYIRTENAKNKIVMVWVDGVEYIQKPMD